MPASRAPRLWAPWRGEYIEAAVRPRKRAGKAEPCLFCRVGAARKDRENFVIARGAKAFAMLNRYPYNPGHLMVAAYRHAGSFSELTAEESAAIVELIALAERALGAEYRPSGMNYGVNTGRSAGAGVLGHLHVHLVPRWEGDTNFMPVIGETKVLPESLERTWARLAKAMRSAQGARGARRTRRVGAGGRRGR